MNQPGLDMTGGVCPELNVSYTVRYSSEFELLVSALSENSPRAARSSVSGTVTSTNRPAGDKFACFKTFLRTGMGAGVGLGARVGVVDEELTSGDSPSRSTMTSSI